MFLLAIFSLMMQDLERGRPQGAQAWAAFYNQREPIGSLSDMGTSIITKLPPDCVFAFKPPRNRQAGETGPPFDFKPGDIVDLSGLVLTCNPFTISGYETPKPEEIEKLKADYLGKNGCDLSFRVTRKGTTHFHLKIENAEDWYEQGKSDQPTILPFDVTFKPKQTRVRLAGPVRILRGENSLNYVIELVELSPEEAQAIAQATARRIKTP